MLVIAMVTGVLLYVGYHFIDALHPAGPKLLAFCSGVQPVLIFSMLFLTFLKVRPSGLRLQGWHIRMLLVQGVVFAAGCIALSLAPPSFPIIGAESFLLCMICPTATACAVVTDKLGGDPSQVLSYTFMINLLAAVLIPLMIPLLHPVGDVGFIGSFLKIITRVFPMLIAPCLCAWGVMYLFPALHATLVRHSGLSFYIWAVALTFAIMMSTRSLFNHAGGAVVLVETAGASLVSCILQFAMGKRLGGITAGQAMGQKNTVFAIWLGYSFFNPVTSLAGGFYAIWHNLYNTWQLRKPVFRVEKAIAGQIPEYLEICAQAKEKMRSSGNMHQWEGDYPSAEIIASDISSGCGYAVLIENRPVAYFCLLDRPEPTYSKIYGGRWLDDSLPYGTIHRIASIHGIHGAARFIFEWCGALAGNIRIDTHRDNVIMKHILEKEGFAYCGTIYLANGDERLAYQKFYK